MRSLPSMGPKDTLLKEVRDDGGGGRSGGRTGHANAFQAPQSPSPHSRSAHDQPCGGGGQRGGPRVDGGGGGARLGARGTSSSGRRSQLCPSISGPRNGP